MQNALLIGLSRQMALSRELDVVANNLANTDTTGYKADGSLFEEYLSSAARGERGLPVSYVRDRATWVDMSRGPIQHTGNPLDLAIDGKAFFAVQTPRGVRYTRNGTFQLDASGQIVTADGDTVLGDGGPIKLQPTDSQISISRDGIISVRVGASNVDTQRGKLRLVRFANLRQLQKDGGGMFNYVGSGQPQDATKSSVIQGALEKSNVRGVVEMSRMIEISRSYMQVAKILTLQSDLGQTAIDKLAALPN
jgi:flagellar basal-body rod protein FlgF